MKKIALLLVVFLGVLVCCAFDFYSDIKLTEDNGIYIVKLNNMVLEPFVVEQVATNKDVYDKNDFLLSINAGYFDTINKKTTSFVTIDKKMVLNPKENENLVNNPNLKNNLEQIYNRSELRYLQCGRKYKYTIQKHNEPIEKKCVLINALQAGPQLLPEITAEEEFFISKNKNEITRNPISIDRKVSRIAVGLDLKNHLYIFLASKKAPMTLSELADFMNKKGIVSALNLDGGGSVSFNYKNIDVFSDAKNTRRKVKSFFVVKKY